MENKEEDICEIIEPENPQICKAITFKDQRTILKSIDNPKYLKFFYFCCCTGMRVCEALSIQTKNIHKRKHVIQITLPDTKTKKHYRAVPYLPELFDGTDLSGEFLFEDITEDGSRQYFGSFYKKLELDLSRHSTRHTFISVCNHIKIKPQTIQTLVGHTDLKMTTDTYTHILENGSSPVLSYLKKLKKELKNHKFLEPPKDKKKTTSKKKRGTKEPSKKKRGTKEPSKNKATPNSKK